MNHDERGVNLSEDPPISHAIRLRSRLLRAVMALGIAFVPCVIWSSELFTLIAQPLLRDIAAHAQQLALNRTTFFVTPLKLASLAAMFIALPAVLYQLWAGAAPRLQRQVRRLAFPLLLSSIVSFYLGVALAYFVVRPLLLQSLGSMPSEGLIVALDPSRYLEFVVLLCLALGAAFEIPPAMVLLTATGLVRTATLAKRRVYVVLMIVVIVGALAPPDPLWWTFSTTLLYVLYELGILISRLISK